MQLYIPTCKADRAEAVARALFLNENSHRALAIETLNKYAHQFGDLITGKRILSPEELAEYQLSQPSRFPTNDPARPAALFRTEDRVMADMTWTGLFDVQDFRNTAEESFDIADVYDAVTFTVLPDGVDIKVAGVRGTETNYKFQDVGGGFQYSINWERDNKFWRITNGLAAMQARYAQKMGSLAWSVACASGLSTTTRDATASTTTGKDIRTINTGMDEIINAIYTDTDADGNTTDEWMGEPTFVVAYNNTTSLYTERAQQIQATNYGVPNDLSSGYKLAYPATFIGNPYVTTGNFYLFLPGRKFVSGIRQDLEIFPDFDPYKRVDARVGYGRYRHVRGDTKQGRIIPLS